MIRFILTSWWLYIPLAGILLFLTFRNNQKIKGIKLDRELRSLSPAEREKRLHEIRTQPKKLKSVSSKYGLSGILGHIFPKK
jgi:hypothetical protein